MRPATASPPPFTRYSTEPLGGTQTEVSELEAGSSFEFEVRARSVDGWAKYTAPLRERTMVPDDFPLPLLAPEVSGFVDCSTLRLRLPVLRYCFTSTHMALQYENGHAPGSWQLLNERVLGGEMEVGGLHAYAAHRFRLIGFEQSIDNAATPGAATPPVLTDLPHAPLLAPPAAIATSSASYSIRWAGDSAECRPQASWRLTYRLADAGPRGTAGRALAGGAAAALPLPLPAPAAAGSPAAATRLGGALLNRRRLKMGCPPQWEAYGRDCFLASEVKLSATEHKRLEVCGAGSSLASSRTRGSWGWRRGCARSRSPGSRGWAAGSAGRTHVSPGEEGGLRGRVAPRRPRRGATERTCCDACRGTSGCAGWVLDTSLGRCTLFATIVATYPATEMVAGHVGGGAWRWEDNTEMSLEQLGATGRRWGAWAKAPDGKYTGVPIVGARCSLLQLPATTLGGDLPSKAKKGAAPPKWAWVEGAVHAVTRRHLPPPDRTHARRPAEPAAGGVAVSAGAAEPAARAAPAAAAAAAAARRAGTTARAADAAVAAAAAAASAAPRHGPRAALPFRRHQQRRGRRAARARAAAAWPGARRVSRLTRARRGATRAARSRHTYGTATSADAKAAPSAPS